MKFKEFIAFFPPAIEENHVTMTPEELEELSNLLEGLEKDRETTKENLKQWIGNHPAIRDAVGNLVESDRENVQSSLRQPSNEAKILQNMFELRQVVQKQKDKKSKNS